MNIEPLKMIKSIEDIEVFKKSTTYANFVDWILALQSSITGKSISSINRIHDFVIFDKYFLAVQAVLDKVQPESNNNRFGNLAFRKFVPLIIKENKELIKSLVECFKINNSTIDELEFYLNESFGNATRIDYGTGHELNFMIFLFGFSKLIELNSSLYENLVHQVFYDYIFTMRKVQLQYNLEPAGSHGVWGLDDYHFLPFIFGASELINNMEIQAPSYIHKPEVLDMYKDDYMYLNCIAFIKKVKSTAPFAITSPILNDISVSSSWEKVSRGMVLMYKDEVLSKFPIVQHLRFGKLFIWNN